MLQLLYILSVIFGSIFLTFLLNVFLFYGLMSLNIPFFIIIMLAFLNGYFVPLYVIKWILYTPHKELTKIE